MPGNNDWLNDDSLWQSSNDWLDDPTTWTPGLRPEKVGLAERFGRSLISGARQGLADTQEALGDLIPDLANDESRAQSEAVARGLGFQNLEHQQATQKANRMANTSRRVQAVQRPNDAVEAGHQAIADADGWIDSAKAIWDNPAAVFDTVAHSLGMVAPGMAAAVGTGPAAPAVIGAQSGAIEYSATIRDTLEQEGVDLTNPSELTRALRDPKLMERARERGLKRGVPIAAFDAITAGVAGRLVAGARGVTSAATRTGGELGVQAGGGMAGESVAQLADTGQVGRPGDVLMEGIAELPTGIPEAATNYGRAREASNIKELAQGDYRAMSDIFDMEITSMQRGIINRGARERSQHPKGTAADFRTRGKTEEQIQALMAEGRKRGYEVIDERNTDQPHIHMEIPKGKTFADFGANVAERRQTRSEKLASREMTDGMAAAEDFLDTAREKRGMPLNVEAQKPKSAPGKSTSATPTPLDDMIREREDATAKASDITLPAPVRRDFKARSQQLAQELQAQTKQTEARVERAKETLLNELTKPIEQVIAETAPQALPQTNTPAAQVEPQAAPAPAPVPEAPAPQPAAVAPPEQVRRHIDVTGQPEPWWQEPQPLGVEGFEGATSQPTKRSEIVRNVFNKDTHLREAINGGLKLWQGQVHEVTLAPAQQRNVDRLARLLNRDIILFDVQAEGGYYVNGLTVSGDGKHIFINARASALQGVSLVRVIGHEFTHTLMTNGNADMRALVREAAGLVNRDNSYVARRIQMYQKAYGGRMGVDIEAAAMEELVADMIGDLLADEQFWAELAAENPSLMRRILKRFITFLNDLGKRAKRLGDQEAFAEISQLQEKAKAILRAHINRNQQENIKLQPEPFAQASIGDDNMMLAAYEPKDQSIIEMSENDPPLPNFTREVAEEASAVKAAQHLEAGAYGAAAAESYRFTPEYAPPVPIDTPEKREFFKDSSRKVNRRDLAGVYFHGTARDITRFEGNQGDATFLAERSNFTGPFAASSMEWMAHNGQYDVILDGVSMREERKQHKPGSVDYVLADILLTSKGDLDLAASQLEHYAYVDSADWDVTSLDQETQDAVMEKLEQVAFLWDQDPGFITLNKSVAPPSGMTTYPLVTNASNPFDFTDITHRKRLLKDLKESYRTTKELGYAMQKRHKFESWEEVDETINNKDSNWQFMEDKVIVDTLKELGFDSYFVSEMGHKNLAVFDPRSIKSAYGNVGTWGRRVPTPEEASQLGMTQEEAIAAQQAGDIRLSLNTTLYNTFIGPMINPTKSMRASIERWLLDEFRDLKEIQNAIGQQVFGGRVPPSMDAYRNENLRHGAYQDAASRAEERFIKPISRILSKNGYDIAEFSRYLWWRHATERDAYLRAKLDPSVQVAPDGLAGIDPADARANIAGLDPHKRAMFERAAKFIDGMRDFTNKTLLDSGQITQEHYNNITAQYDHYVPLRGMPDGSESLNPGFGATRGLSMNPNALGKRAMGRKSEPSNIIEEMMRDMDNALVGAQKQRVLESLVRLIAANPDPTLWEISPVDAKRKWVNGVLTVVQANGEPKDQLTFMHRGVPVKIEIRHEGLKQAMLNMNTPLPQALRFMGRITRWLSAVKTSFSPFFLLVNPVRDAQLATMGVVAEKGMAAAEKVAEFYPHAYAVLLKDTKRKVAPSAKPKIAKLQQYAREFGAIGGKTGYTYVNDIREQHRKLRHLLDRHADSKGMKDIMAGNFGTKDAMLIGRKSFQHVAHLFEVVNDMAENSTRLAVYAAMRESGMTVEDAAAYAKEVTVNFNRRGILARYLGPFYMFFNASVQGGARLVRLSKNKKFAAMLGSMFAGSYALALAQMFAAGDDDDGESKYEKAVTDAQAQRYISVYVGEGKSITIPVPYGPNIFTYAGYRMAKMHYDLARGRETGPVAGDIMAQALMSMSPIDPGRGPAAFLPEAARIPAQVAINKNDFGSPIAPKVDPRDRTGNPRFYDTDNKTALPFRVMAEAINAATGGDKYEGGMVNITGEHVKYVYEQFGGGLARLGAQSYELAETLFAGVDPEPSDVPLANVYFRGKGEGRHAGTYYDNIDDYENTIEDWKLAIANGDERKLDEIYKHAPWVEGSEVPANTKAGKDVQAGSVMEAKRAIDRQMKSIKQRRNAIMADEALSFAERKQALHALDLEQAGLQQDFNYAINAGRGYHMPQQSR